MTAEYLVTNQASQSPTTSYLTTDTLGSPRVITDQAGNVQSRRDFMPFGEEINGLGGRNQTSGYQSDNVRQKFTSYERDNESELDFAQARYYSSKLGRFYSVDPENAGASEDDPQSWNGYAYVGNNPIFFTDPTGLWKQVDCSSGQCWEAEKGDTLTSLAKIVGVSANSLTQFFGDVNPTNIQIGHTLDVSGYANWAITTSFASIGIDIQGGGINPNDPKYVQKIPPEMQPDMPTGNYIQDGLPIFAEGAEDGLNLFLWLRSGIDAKKAIGGRPRFPNGIDKKLTTEILNGNIPRSRLTPQQREAAAQFYEKTAQKINPNSSYRDKQKLYNEDRARYLREGGTPPGGYTDWSKRHP